MAKTARKVKNLKRNYNNLKFTNVNKVYEINPRGLNAVLRIMRENNLGYDCELQYVTFPLVEMYKAGTREIYQINTTGQILIILDYIKQNGLLEEGKRVIL